MRHFDGVAFGNHRVARSEQQAGGLAEEATLRPGQTNALLSTGPWSASVSPFGERPFYRGDGTIPFPLPECRCVRRVLVANPGGQLHLKEAAAAFADRAILDTYISTAGFGPREVDYVRRLQPRSITAKLAIELQRRMVSEEVGPRAVRVAMGWEVANVLLNRAPVPNVS